VSVPELVSSAITIQSAADSVVAKPRFTFPKRRRILKSADFRLVGRAGQRRIGELLIVEVLAWRNTRRPTQLGLTVSRKFGDSVHRNRFKRLVREAFRRHQHSLPAAMAFVISPRSAALGCDGAALEEELLRLCSAAAPR
jgi:ribonuclease P protein component